MIFATKVTFSAKGSTFRPSLARLPFSSFHDTGAIGTCGIYRGVPTPYGAADFDDLRDSLERGGKRHRVTQSYPCGCGQLEGTHDSGERHRPMIFAPSFIQPLFL
jgi:hypothetical protein